MEQRLGKLGVPEEAKGWTQHTAEGRAQPEDPLSAQTWAGRQKGGFGWK